MKNENYHKGLIHFVHSTFNSIDFKFMLCSVFYRRYVKNVSGKEFCEAFSGFRALRFYSYGVFFGKCYFLFGHSTFNFKL